MKTGSCNLKIFFQLFVVFFFCLALSATVFAKKGVSGKYDSIAPNTIQFRVKIAHPAPTNLIVQHFHAAGTQLTGSNPRPSKVNAKKGFVKWFLKGVNPGTISFSLSFNKAVPRQSLRAIVRYRDPQTGQFTETIVQP